MKYNKDKSVSFDEKRHAYFFENKKLISVTEFISNFKNKFDEDFYSKKIALRDNKTQQQVLDEWKEKAKKSCDIGTAIHKIFEDYTNKEYSKINNSLHFEYLKIQHSYVLDFEIKRKIALSFINDFFETNRLIPIQNEIIVNDNYLAGQIDCLCKDKNGNFYIIDFKTNDKIEKYSYNKKMLGVFNFLNDSNYYHYSLQLSIYKKLLKEHDIKKMYLIHIKNDSYEFIECEDIFEKYSVNYNSLF